MFSKRPDEMPSETLGTPSVRPSATVIANGVRVEGDFVSQGDVVIEGEVHGKVAVTGMLTVGGQAKLKADVSAENISIAGTIEGNVAAKSRVDIKSSAKISGDIQAQTAAVEAGAVLDGRMMIGASPRQANLPSTTSAPDVQRNRGARGDARSVETR